MVPNKIWSKPNLVVYNYRPTSAGDELSCTSRAPPFSYLSYNSPRVTSIREEVAVHILCTLFPWISCALFFRGQGRILDSGLFWQRFTLPPSPPPHRESDHTYQFRNLYNIHFNFAKTNKQIYTLPLDEAPSHFTSWSNSCGVPGCPTK